MGGMDSMPGHGARGLGFYVTVWVVMMAAMMFPSVAPTVLMYDRLREGHRATGQGAAPDATALFVAGYLVVWTRGRPRRVRALRAGRAVDPAFLAWDDGRSLRDRRRDRGRGHLPGDAAEAGLPGQVPQPDDVPRRALAPRPRGRSRAGARHGAWCLGCCWALMAALFAVGVMSLGWMALIAAFIAGEKLLPWPAPRAGPWRSCCSLLGLGVAIAPADVPGFAEPGMRCRDSGGGTAPACR